MSGAPVTTAALALLPLLAWWAEGAETKASVRLVVRGAAVRLSDQEASDLAGRVRSLMVGCAINSVTQPAMFSGRALREEWQRALAGSHLYVRFPQPLRARRGDVPMSEVAIGLETPSFIGPELSMHGDQAVGHVKCDGHRSLAVMCAPSVRPHLSPKQAANCAVYDRMGEPRDDGERHP